MKRATIISLFSLTLLLTAITASAQNEPNPGTVGLTASLQNVQTNIEIPIWASQNIVIAPMIGLNYQEDNYTTINIGLSPRFYQHLGNNFATYIGAQGIVQQTSPNFGNDITDVLIGATGGGEYFLSDHFSIGVEGQLNYLFNDNGGNILKTSTAIAGSVYF